MLLTYVFSASLSSGKKSGFWEATREMVGIDSCVPVIGRGISSRVGSRPRGCIAFRIACLPSRICFSSRVRFSMI